MSATYNPHILQIHFAALAQDQQLIAAEAMTEFGIEKQAKVIRHEIETQIKYLVEFPNGERSWVKGRFVPAKVSL